VTFFPLFDNGRIDGGRYICAFLMQYVIPPFLDFFGQALQNTRLNIRRRNPKQKFQPHQFV
jgi:hypothetical protein